MDLPAQSQVINMLIVHRDIIFDTYSNQAQHGKFIYNEIFTHPHANVRLDLCDIFNEKCDYSFASHNLYIRLSKFSIIEIAS